MLRCVLELRPSPLLHVRARAQPATRQLHIPFCRCYENGFTDVYGEKHLGPHCLKRDGDGTTIATPKQGEHGVLAFEGNAPKAPPGVINELKETARLLKRKFRSPRLEGPRRR